MFMTNSTSTLDTLREELSELLSKAVELVDSLSSAVDSCDLVAKIATIPAMARLFGYDAPLPESSKDIFGSYIRLSGSVWYHRTFYYLSKILEAMSTIEKLRLEDLNLDLPKIRPEVPEQIHKLLIMCAAEREHDLNDIRFHIRQGTLNQVSWPLPDPDLCDPCFLLERYRNNLHSDERLTLVEKIMDELKLFINNQKQFLALSSIWWGAANLALAKDKPPGLPVKLAADVDSLLPKLVSNLMREEKREKLVFSLKDFRRRYELLEVLNGEENAEAWAWAYTACNALDIYDVWYRTRRSDEQIAQLMQELRRFIGQASFNSNNLYDRGTNLFSLSFLVQVHAKQQLILEGRRSTYLKEARTFLDQAVENNALDASEFAVVGSYISYRPETFKDETSTVRKQVENYINTAKKNPAQRPLNILLCGPPGAGKSFFVEQLRNELKIGDKLFFFDNLTQMETTEDLLRPFEQLLKRRDKAEGEERDAVRVVFLDEVDMNPVEFRQYARLLMPMWDKEIISKEIISKGDRRNLGPLIIFFGASNASSYEEFRANLIGNSDIEKGADFLSRLEHHLDIPGLEYPENRILVAASLLKHKLKYHKTEKRALEAIGAAEFEYNARQLEQALCRCGKSEAEDCFRYEQLPESIKEQLGADELNSCDSEIILLK